MLAQHGFQVPGSRGTSELPSLVQASLNLIKTVIIMVAVAIITIVMTITVIQYNDQSRKLGQVFSIWSRWWSSSWGDIDKVSWNRRVTCVKLHQLRDLRALHHLYELQICLMNCLWLHWYCCSYPGWLCHCGAWLSEKHRARPESVNFNIPPVQWTV